MTEFNLGLWLYKRYKVLLREIYYPDLLLARSTDTPRTKMSLQLVLAGLMPPAAKQIWNGKLYWQPIPTTYLPAQTDFVCLFIK